MTNRILTLVHQADSTPGRVGELLNQRGYVLERCCPNVGEPLPASLDDYAATIIFGGPMSANDDATLPGIGAELAWLEATALRAGRPVVGICLGAQLIARALGARVGPHPEGLVEIGYYPIRPSADGWPYFEQPLAFYQWHAETFELPAGAAHLAESDAFANQAFRYGENVFGLEFHPEMTLAMIERWTASEGGTRQLHLPGAQPREAHLQGYWRFAVASDRWLGRFLDRHVLQCQPEDAQASSDLDRCAAD